MMRSIAAALFAACPLLASAQVGYPPARSPFHDLEYRQEASVFAGWFNAGTDKARVAPRSGPAIGVRYDVRIGGPAQFTARFARVWSERTPVDPTEPAATRRLPAEDWPLYLTDAGITVNLTGQKSWHRFVPDLHGGVGLASDLKSKGDVGGYRFGTTFAFSFGAGFRWTPGGHWQLRATLSDWLYQVRYPPGYFAQASDGTAVLGPRDPDSVWKHNVLLTIGGAYAFWR